MCSSDLVASRSAPPAAIDVVGPDDAVTSWPETVAVIVAAGGAERDATQWLETHRVHGGLPALVVGTDPGRRMAMQLVARGASDYFALPDDLEIFRTAVAGAVTRGRARGGAAPDGREDAFAAIVGESDTIKTVLARAARLLPHRNATVLIVGETGTGKELLARALHAGGPRRDAPFVAINCSALPEHLIESELFGHERGSFTDAHAAKPGLFEVANTGTLFLDEIADLPLAVQAKLHARLRAHAWPGNVRELKNALERALLLSPAGELLADELLPPEETRAQHDGPIPFPARLHAITTAAVQATVQLCGGNRSESARRLGISPRRLRRLLHGGEDLGLDLDAGDLDEPLLHAARANVRWRGRFARPATHGLVRPD